MKRIEKLNEFLASKKSDLELFGQKFFELVIDGVHLVKCILESYQQGMSLIGQIVYCSNMQIRK